MFEKTRFTDRTITLFAPVKTGSNIVQAGEDVQAGQLLAQAGDRIDAGMAGTLASQAVSRPQVYRRLRIGIFSTGNEVIEIDAPMAPGKIRNSNRYTLETALSQAGMEPVWLGSAGDRTEDIAGLIRRGLDSGDALVGTGGSLNYGGFSDPALDAQITTAFTTVSAPSSANETMLSTLQSAAPIAVICFKSQSVVVQGGAVDEITPTCFNPFYQLSNWEIHIKGEATNG